MSRPAFNPDAVNGRDGVQIPPELNALTGRIIGAAIEVHRVLGPGIREQHCERALLHELQLAGLCVETQVPFRVLYKGLDLGMQIMDVVVERQVLVECKSVVQVHEVDHAQLLGYLRFTGLPVGLLINFNVPLLRNGIVRRINFPPVAPTSHLHTLLRDPSVPSVSTP